MKNIFQKSKDFFQPRMIVEIVFYLISLGMGIYFQWEIMNLFFFLILLRVLIHPIPSRIPAGAAISLLVVTAILLVFKREAWAENAAILAYYSMILVLVMAISELKRESD